MTDTELKYNHVTKDFGDVVHKEIEKLDILKYYPYGPETKWTYWLCGDVDLTKRYLDKRNKGKKEIDYVLSIYDEIGRAMNYLMLNGEHWRDHQRIEAFALFRLFHSGIVGWNKKIIEGKTVKEIESLEEQHKKLYDKTYGLPKVEDWQAKRWKKYPEEKIKHDKMMLKSKLYNRKKYGIYTVTHLPLTQHANTATIPKILYTKQQLAAIDLMVTCYFENLC